MTALYWCNVCEHVLKSEEQLRQCPHCGRPLGSMATDIRPVFARERHILEFYGHGDLSKTIVWRGSHNQYYYINGQSVEAPSSAQLKGDLSTLRAYLNESDHYDTLDERLIAYYRRALEVNRSCLASLESEAIEFIQQVRSRFHNHPCLVSFSGGKDSTVVSDLVRRALHPEQITHIFSDTTLEDLNTYAYIRRFREQNPLVSFWEARSEKNFFALVGEIGPPSRVMRWCCTIFKTGPINNLLQSFGEKKVLTFYGIRRRESQRRSQYDRVGANSDKPGHVLAVDPDDDQHGVTVGAKIGQQITASPILDWSEFDVWLYILLHGLDFNDAYRWGFSRVGCWLCPLNSRWSEFLTRLYFPEEADRWREQLIGFARRIGKPDPEEYVDDRAWTRRFGGAGMTNRFAGLDTRPCGEVDDAVQITLRRPVVQKELLEFLKPLGHVDIARSQMALGKMILEARRDNGCSELMVQAIKGDNTLRVTVLDSRDPDRVISHVRSQAIKYQTCIRCSACAAACPHGAIIVSTDPDLYEIDETRCTGCLECVTHFGSTGCLVAKSLSVYGESV
ncbi:MAG TPA: phosphoadenosine phosphosulfate reductase family protein [Anaerolineae bacterium]|nr:phosphoadenosine phosphosulfate reductase family protein [Anaerolineae bacterium]